MLIHASCAAREGNGVLLTGPSGAGKSDLLLRLLDHGFSLVADDQVEICNGHASPPRALEGLLEIRGLGILRFSFLRTARLALSVTLGRGERMPLPRHDPNGLPLVTIDPTLVSATHRVALALDCALGRRAAVAGAFAPW